MEPKHQIITNGTTVTLHGDDTTGMIITLDNPAAPDDMRNLEAGRVDRSQNRFGFQPHPFATFAMGSEVLRAIARLLDQKQEETTHQN